MEFIKKNGFIIVAFALPILLILGLTASVYLPSKLISTNYDFAYASCGDGIDFYDYRYDCENYLNSIYSVIEGKLVVGQASPTQDSDRDGTPDVDENYVTRIFLHNTETNESREVTEEEALSLEYNELLTSPDGVAVEGRYNRSADFFPFYGGSSNYGYFLTKGGKGDRLNLINHNDRYYYRDNFKFIGWVIPGRGE